MQHKCIPSNATFQLLHRSNLVIQEVFSINFFCPDVAPQFIQERAAGQSSVTPSVSPNESNKPRRHKDVPRHSAMRETQFNGDLFPVQRVISKYCTWHLQFLCVTFCGTNPRLDRLNYFSKFFSFFLFNTVFIAD